MSAEKGRGNEDAVGKYGREGSAREGTLNPTRWNRVTRREAISDTNPVRAKASLLVQHGLRWELILTSIGRVSKPACFLPLPAPLCCPNMRVLKAEEDLIFSIDSAIIIILRCSLLMPTLGIPSIKETRS